MDRPLSTDSIKDQRRSVAIRVFSAISLVALLFLATQWIFTPSLDLSRVRVAQVTEGPISATLNAGGVVIPYVEETISSEIDSRVVAVTATVGSRVKLGDPILTLDTQSVALKIANLQEKIALKETQVKTKQLQLANALNENKGRSALLEVDLESRETRAARLLKLSEVGAFSEDELLEAQLNVKRTQLELQQIEQSSKDRQSTTDAEIQGLNLEKSILETELAEQQRLLEKSTVRATRDGVLVWIKSEEGVAINSGESLAKIADTSRFKIEANLSDFYASQLVPGMPAKITHNERVFYGKLASEAPTIDDGLMKLIIELNNPQDQLLKPNLRVDVGLVTETLENAIQVAKGPFVTGRGIHQVFVLKDNQAVRKEVEIGFSNADFYQIVRGLNDGDRVIISDVKDYLHLEQFSVN